MNYWQNYQEHFTDTDLTRLTAEEIKRMNEESEELSNIELIPDPESIPNPESNQIKAIKKSHQIDLLNTFNNKQKPIENLKEAIETIDKINKIQKNISTEIDSAEWVNIDILVKDIKKLWKIIDTIIPFFEDGYNTILKKITTNSLDEIKNTFNTVKILLKRLEKRTDIDQRDIKKISTWITMIYLNIPENIELEQYQKNND